MFSLTLAAALLPYAAVVIVFVLIAAYVIFSMIRHGATTFSSFVATFAFLAGATFVLFFTWQALDGTDWQQQMEISPAVSIGNDYPL